MTKLDALQTTKNWRERVLLGTPSQIQQFIQEATRLLPPNWHRDEDHENRYSAAEVDHPGSLCFKWAPRPGVVVVLWLLRFGDGELRGGLVESTDKGRYTLDAAEAIREFESAVLVPAAKVSGVRLTTKRPGPRSVMPEHVLAVLQEFLHTSERTWPLTEDAAKKWRRFMISAYQSETLLDPEEFRAWLLACEWTPAEIEALMAQFFADARLLSEYEDERQPA